MQGRFRVRRLKPIIADLFQSRTWGFPLVRRRSPGRLGLTQVYPGRYEPRDAGQVIRLRGHLHTWANDHPAEHAQSRSWAYVLIEGPQ